MRRRDLVVLVASTVALSAVVTWVGAAQIRSPAEVAAQTAAPTPSPILATVERRVLSTRVVTRGTARFDAPARLVLTTSALKSAERVVTSLPRRGAVVRAGDVLLTVSGRPVFLFQGALPSYRDLGPGLAGPDVAQLERGLAAAGFAPGPVDGRYDAATGSAVAALYRSHGSMAMTATDQQLAEVAPAEAALLPGSTATAGVQLPADEVVFVAAAPVRVSALHAEPGSPPEGAVLAYTGSRVVVSGALPVEQAALVQRDARVVIDEPALGINARGRVTQVAGRAGTGGADEFHVAFEVVVPDPQAGMVGSSVRLTVPIRSTRTAELTVPVSAVSLGPDGRTRVQKAGSGGSGGGGAGGDGGPTYLPVRTGLSVDGYVAVTPLEGSLVEGDEVVVGIGRDRARG